MTHRTALITGASRGLGLALAQQLALQGWTLILDARGAEALSAARQELSALTDVITIAGDVTDKAHQRALADAAQLVSGLDAVVNNASMLGPSPQPFLLDYPLDMLEQVYRTNVIAPLAILQSVRDVLKPGAVIINVTSDAGVEAYPGWGGYGSSKAALEHLSAILGAENPSLRVYWVDPGDMRTRMQQEAFPGEDISDRPLPAVSVPGLLRLLEGDLPSGRYRAREVPSAPGSPASAVNRSHIHELRVALTVSDFDNAIAFYRDKLGLPMKESWASADGKGAVLAIDQATLELLDQTHTEYVDQIEVGKNVSSGPARLALEVGNVERIGDDFQAVGAHKLNGPVRTPWGDYNLRLQTPEGLQITLFQKQAEAQDVGEAAEVNNT